VALKSMEHKNSTNAQTDSPGIITPRINSCIRKGRCHVKRSRAEMGVCAHLEMGRRCMKLQ
jgi:hypothetical protein